MTVKELIAELQKLNPDATVVYNDLSDEGWYQLLSVQPGWVLPFPGAGPRVIGVSLTEQPHYRPALILGPAPRLRA